MTIGKYKNTACFNRMRVHIANSRRARYILEAASFFKNNCATDNGEPNPLK
jgi:hypothetical protein